MDWEPTNSILAQPLARLHTGKNGEAEVGADGRVTTSVESYFGRGRPFTVSYCRPFTFSWSVPVGRPLLPSSSLLLSS
jgi:hypothetical protein